MRDHLGDFQLDVIGVCLTQGICAVGVEYLYSEATNLEAQIFLMRDEFMFKGEALSALKVEHPEVFTKPRDPAQSAPSALPAPVVHRAPVVPQAAAPPPVARIPTGNPLFSSPQRRLVYRVVESTAPPALSEVPAMPQGQDLQAGMTELLGHMREMKRYMTTELVTRAQLDQYHSEQTQYIASSIEHALNPVYDEITLVKTRLADLENRSSHPRSASVQPRGVDPAHKQVAFTKIVSGIDAENRVQKVEEFFTKHFPHVRVKDVQNIYSGPFSDRKLTSTVLVEVSNSDVRKAVLETVKSKSLDLKLGGQSVTIKKALTEDARRRNAALRRAADLLKGERAKHATVKIEWTGERGVTVDGAYAFSQGKKDLTGTFTGAYADLKLP